MIGICPSCGDVLKGEPGAKENLMDLCQLCNDPSALPTGVRLMPDQASLIFTDGKMVEYKREDYKRVYGFDPLPVWEAIVRQKEAEMGTKIPPVPMRSGSRPST
jgi:hypothetical protein